MKKFSLVLLALCLMAGAACLPTAAADTRVYKTYDEAKDGDLLWLVDFTATEVIDPQPDPTAAQNFDYTIGDGGRSVSIKAKPNAPLPSKPNYWGGPIKGLEVGRGDRVTMTFKIKAAPKGADNSTGVGGWMFDSTEAYNTQICHNYSNWNSYNADGSDIQNRSVICIGRNKKANNTEYTYHIDAAGSDDEGFMTCKMEYDAQENIYRVFYLDWWGEWIEDMDNCYPLEQLNDTPDNVCFLLYAYSLNAEVTVKDVRYYRGVGLTDAKLAGKTEPPQTTESPAPVETAPTAETTAGAAAEGTESSPMPEMTSTFALVVLLMGTAAAVLIKRNGPFTE